MRAVVEDGEWTTRAVTDGRPVDFRQNEILYWLEALAWRAAGTRI